MNQLTLMTFESNGLNYELNYTSCIYYPSSNLESFNNMTHIRGVQNIFETAKNDSTILGLDLPEINIYIPGQKTGTWTELDTISFVIGVEKNITFVKEKNKFTDSEFLIEIEDYDDIFCVGKFSGDLKNEYNDNLKIENGRFKIKIEK